MIYSFHFGVDILQLPEIEMDDKGDDDDDETLQLSEIEMDDKGDDDDDETV
jgi:hypothetical protein